VTAPVRDLLEAWTRAIHAKDLEGALALWTDDRILSGSSEGELAVDAGVEAFLSAVFGTDLVLGWSWEEPVVRAFGDVAWFYADATLHVEGMKDMPYRASGVVRLVDGEWRFAMWAGAEPS
jgi:ketosteroid isomerase-like protein